MFEFAFGDDLEILARTARGFATRELTPRLRTHERARSVDDTVRTAYAAMQLGALEIAEDLGGSGLGGLARVLVNEELAAGDPGATLALDPLGPALYALAEMGGTDAVRAFALPLLEVDGARALLVTEREGQLAGDIALSGQVPWVPADRVDLLVVLRGDEALVVREGIEHIELPGGGLRAAGASELRLASAPIVARWREAAGCKRALARARLYLASLLVGVLRQANDYSRRYALERLAFGRPIAHHQGLTFLIMDMHAAVDGARLLLHEAAWRFDRGLPCETAAAAAFVEAVQASLLVGPGAVQILGGHGFMQDHPVEKHMRESRLLGLMLGGADAARDDAADVLDYSDRGLDLSYVSEI